MEEFLRNLGNTDYGTEKNSYSFEGYTVDKKGKEYRTP